MKPFERIAIVPVTEPPQSAGTEGRAWACDHCEAAMRAAVTEIQVNYLSTPMHQILCEDPTKVYHWFSHYAPSLDQFATSRLFRGVYSPPLIAANCERARVLAEEAIEHGLKPFLYCAEPRFAPERIFRSRPDLRGPRVDNPGAGGTPYYALCTDIPEVREHYCEMLTQIMERIPQIQALSLFTSDSGAGFCHSPNLYAGPNGPRHCREVSPADRLATFCRELIDAGRQINPDFEIRLNSHISPEIRAQLATRHVDGLRLPIYGLYSWCGGLEDMWAYHQYGSRIEEVGFAAARHERLADLRRRLEAARVSDDCPWALGDFPTNQYFAALRYVPQPFELLRILRLYADLGVRHLALRGIMNTPEQVRYDLNAEVLAAYQASPEDSDEELIGGIIQKWGATAAGEALLSAVARVDEAMQQRPNWRHCYGVDAHLMAGPLVPDPLALSREELAYYDNICFDELLAVGGPTYFLPNLGDLQEYEYALRKYQFHTLPLLEQATNLLRDARQQTSDAAEAVLAEQQHFIELLQSHFTSQFHWVQMSYLWHGGTTEVNAAQIVAQEIENTRRFVNLLGKEPGRWLALAELKGCMHTMDPDFADQLRQRIEVMAAHAQDPLAHL